MNTYKLPAEATILSFSLEDCSQKVLQLVDSSWISRKKNKNYLFTQPPSNKIRIYILTGIIIFWLLRRSPTLSSNSDQGLRPWCLNHSVLLPCSRWGLLSCRGLTFHCPLHLASVWDVCLAFFWSWRSARKSYLRFRNCWTNAAPFSPTLT